MVSFYAFVASIMNFRIVGAGQTNHAGDFVPRIAKIALHAWEVIVPVLFGI